MKLTECKINAKDLWDIMSIREETEDHYGRKGRGIDLISFNQEYKDTNFIAEDNIKKPIIKFRQYLKDYFGNIPYEEFDKKYPSVENGYLRILEQFDKIFGEEK
jgi:hypothetical protein